MPNGAVKQADGRAVILAIYGADEVVGELSLLAHLDRSTIVVPLAASTLSWMECTRFQARLDSMPVLARNLLGILARRLRSAQLQALARQDRSGRSTHQVLAFARRMGSPPRRERA